MRIVDWRTHFSLPDEENFLDLSLLDELIISRNDNSSPLNLIY